MSEILRRVCGAADCKERVPKAARADAIYCSERCKNREKARRRRQALKKPERHNAGAALEAILEHDGMMEDLAQGRLQVKEVAVLVGVHESSVSRALQLWRHHVQTARAAEGWEQSERVRWLLAADYDDLVRQALAAEDTETVEKLLDELVDRFMAFEAEYFRTSHQGRSIRFLRVVCHRRWIKETLRAIFTGEAVQIMAPPRHGKSELLVHFCVWLICRNPSITIIWIGVNKEPVAKNMVGMVKATLERNERLIADVLPPGESFRPKARAGAEWAAKFFRVAQADRERVKSPTMTALGRASKVLSMDCDLIICDDIEDHDSTLQPQTRAATRRWIVTQLESRAEEHTGMVIIGSRQHPDDIYGHLLNDTTVTSIVESAHDQDCPLDPAEVAVHVDCMLFPEMRSYAWLRRKQLKAEALAEAERRAAEDEVTTARDKAIRDVWKAYTDVRLAARRLDVAAALVDASQKSYESILESYRRGLETLTNLLVARRELSRARFVELDTKVQLLNASAALAFSTGAPQ